MNAAEDGAVFTLLDDTTLSNNVKICDNNKTVTLNLNGHSIEDGRAFWVGGTRCLGCGKNRQADNHRKRRYSAALKYLEKRRN